MGKFCLHIVLVVTAIPSSFQYEILCDCKKVKVLSLKFKIVRPLAFCKLLNSFSLQWKIYIFINRFAICSMCRAEV